MERTLIIIKPDAMQKKITGLILDRIEEMGLHMTAAKVLRPTEDKIREHYAHLKDLPNLQDIVNFMMGKLNNINPPHLYAFIYEGEDCINRVRKVVGATDPDKADPASIRGQFGRLKDGAIQNAVHASGSAEDAEKEIALWFDPSEIL
ncbi:nucleoside-diphosphate kinase [Parelusimicrobium proximum]|uniref:nucleoside-diphosphate kinase n=1 Tax=Parelusimicrobium proximum TaxID=3228953 RepID=UPI003D16544D